MEPPPEGPGEKERLAEARQVVKQQAFYMKRALDQRNLRDGLKYAAAMLGEPGQAGNHGRTRPTSMRLRTRQARRSS